MKTAHALAASNIRKELKKEFPGIKFSVRSKSFSMGNSVDIDYTDGPAISAVNLIIEKYQYGTFDGMTDCQGFKHDENDKFREENGESKFVHAHRELSEESRQNLKIAIAAHWGEDYNPENDSDPMIRNEWLSTLVHQSLRLADNLKPGEVYKGVHDDSGTVTATTKNELYFAAPVVEAAPVAPVVDFSAHVDAADKKRNAERRARMDEIAQDKLFAEFGRQLSPQASTRKDAATAISALVRATLGPDASDRSFELFMIANDEYVTAINNFHDSSNREQG